MDTVDGSMYSIEGNQIKRKESEFVANGITSKGSTFNRWTTTETTVNEFRNSSERNTDICIVMNEMKWTLFSSFFIGMKFQRCENQERMRKSDVLNPRFLLMVDVFVMNDFRKWWMKENENKKYTWYLISSSSLFVFQSREKMTFSRDNSSRAKKTWVMRRRLIE